MDDPLLFDEAADEQSVRLGRRRDAGFVRRRFDAVADDLELAGGKTAGEQAVPDEIGNADDRRRLAFQLLQPALIDGRQQPPAIVLFLGGVAAVKSDHERYAEAAGDR